MQLSGRKLQQLGEVVNVWAFFNLFNYLVTIYMEMEQKEACLPFVIAHS